MSRQFGKSSQLHNTRRRNRLVPLTDCGLEMIKSQSHSRDDCHDSFSEILVAQLGSPLGLLGHGKPQSELYPRRHLQTTLPRRIFTMTHFKAHDDDSAA